MSDTINILVVMFSRTGHVETLTTSLIETLVGDESKKVNVDLVKLLDAEKKFSGWFGYLRGGMHAAFKGKNTNIDTEPQMTEVDWSKYKTVILACPTWNWSLNPLMRKFMETYKENLLKFDSLYTLSSAGGVTSEYIIKGFEEVMARKPTESLHFTEPQRIDEWDKVVVPGIKEFSEKVLAECGPSPSVS